MVNPLQATSRRLDYAGSDHLGYRLQYKAQAQSLHPRKSNIMQDAPRGGDLALPLIPLKNVVVFPRTIVNLTVGRARSIQALNMAMSGDRHMVVVAQKADEHDEPQLEDLYSVGTLVELRQVRRQPDASLQVEVEALSRVRLLEIVQEEPCLSARVEEVEEETFTGRDAESMMFATWPTCSAITRGSTTKCRRTLPTTYAPPATPATWPTCWPPISSPTCTSASGAGADGP